GKLDLPGPGCFAAVFYGFRFGAGDAEIGEVGLLSGIAPEADSAVEVVALETVDDEAGICSAIHEQAALAAVLFDLDGDPRVELNIGVGLVDEGPLPPQPLPAKAGLGA